MNFFKGLKKGFEEFGHLISGIVNSLLLTVVYILGVGLTSIVAKIVGKKFLERKLYRLRSSYWGDLNLRKQKKEDYLRQF